MRKGSDADAIDHAQSAALREYGFVGYEIATYTQGTRKLAVRAARFQDATGAYGAFTFYRLPGSIPEKIGTLAASDNDRVLFFRGAVLVEVRFDRLTAMSASELRELAAALPQVSGPAVNLPVLPNYLPKRQGGGEFRQVRDWASRLCIACSADPGEHRRLRTRSRRFSPQKFRSLIPMPHLC